MSVFNQCGFFNTIHDTRSEINTSFTGKCERLANHLRAPSRWLAYSVWNGGEVTRGGTSTLIRERQVQFQGMMKVCRFALGVILVLPGLVLGTTLMAVAFTNQEIRLKHHYTWRPMTQAQKDKYEELKKERMTLAQKREGCDPFSCIALSLSSICCLLCCICLKA